MDERPLIPSAPTAARSDRFLDDAGRNAFRDLETPVVASLADGSSGDRPNESSAIDAAYASPSGPAMRAATRGDYAVTRVSRSAITGYSSSFVLASLPLGWANFCLPYSGYFDFAWTGITWSWFLGATTGSFLAWLTARNDHAALLMGVVAEEERERVGRSLWLTRIAFASSAISFLAVNALIFLG